MNTQLPPDLEQFVQAKVQMAEAFADIRRDLNLGPVHSGSSTTFLPS